MVEIIHIDENTNEGKINEVIEKIKSGKHVFALIYMNGCGPCEMTKPEWKKLESTNLLNGINAEILIIDIDKDFVDKLSSVIKTDNIMGFPTIRYIKDSKEEEFEDSDIKEKTRSISSFVDWIKSKTQQKGGKKYRKTMKTRKTRKTNKNTKRGGKWSSKYKRSINCRKPKGFSQKQYCKYGRNKK